jgi:hypothetical protein
VSSYQNNLERYLEFFPKEQILVLLQEDMIADPEATLVKVYQHIGVNAVFRPSSLGQNFNQQTAPKNRFVARSVAWAQALGLKVPLAPALKKNLGKLRRWVTSANSEAYRYPPLPEAIRTALVPKFEADIRYIEGWLNQDLAHWRSKPGKEKA